MERVSDASRKDVARWLRLSIGNVLSGSRLGKTCRSGPLYIGLSVLDDEGGQIFGEVDLVLKLGRFCLTSLGRNSGLAPPVQFRCAPTQRNRVTNPVRRRVA